MAAWLSEPFILYIFFLRLFRTLIAGICIAVKHSFFMAGDIRPAAV